MQRPRARCPVASTSGSGSVAAAAQAAAPPAPLSHPSRSRRRRPCLRRQIHLRALPTGGGFSFLFGGSSDGDSDDERDEDEETRRRRAQAAASGWEEDELDAADAAASSKKKPLSKKDAAAKEAEAELSEEDQELKDKLDLCVLRLSEVGERPDAAALAPAAVRSLAEEVRTSTTSMTSVPKPLKFLRPQYASLCASQEKLSAIGASSEDAARELADVLSVLAISSGTKGGREALKWRLKGKQVSKRRR